jgi:hypothetical protein
MHTAQQAPEESRAFARLFHFGWMSGLSGGETRFTFHTAFVTITIRPS